MTRILEQQPPVVTADLYDLHHQHLQVCEVQFRGFGKICSFFGRCSTVTVFEDHTPVLRALERDGDGRVLVIDGGGSLRVGVMGDRLAETGARNGWRGVIIYGAIRDSLGIDALDLGVKALGATARRGWTPNDTTLDQPVVFGDATFSPGAWVYADRDCVLVSDKELT